MKIHVDDIPKGGLEIEFDGISNVLTDALVSITLPPDITVSPRITGHLQINKDLDKFIISGDIEARVVCKCSRCLRPFEQTISVNLDLTASKAENQAGDYEQDSDLDDNEVLVLNDVIDIGELIAQEISLDIPMKPLCKDDCAGLCPKCGAILDKGECACSKGTEIDPRWKKLVSIKTRLNH